jgi:MoxR-like ATPase
MSSSDARIAVVTGSGPDRSTLDAVLALKDRIGRSVIGQEGMVERLVLGLLSNGHLLVEGLPGLAKTRAIKSLSKNLDARFSRIQFTPDLLPSDITGSDVYFSEAGQGQFRFQEGPVFADLVLADEINRAPAKVQAALLEAMEERHVTVAGKSHPLPPLFMVMATQNPIEQEGTYPLPEAQLDRFLMHVNVGYADEKSEGDIMRMVRSEEAAAHGAGANEADRLPQQRVLEARRQIASIDVAEAVDSYIVALVCATRYPDQLDAELASWIQIGVSPRGAIGLDKVSRARAWLNGRDYVTPDDVRSVVHDVFRHRLVLSYEAHAAGVAADRAIDRVVERVAVA